jgi:signal transduction histidine kinase/ligand-binding sensor domain-containing protein
MRTVKLDAICAVSTSLRGCRALLCVSLLRAAILLAVLLAYPNILRAQYRATNWTADSGLPQNIIRGIVQTPDGYLWIATLNGIARFDGVRFTTFDRSNSPGITANRFAAMVAGKNGDLWLYTEGGTIVRYHQSHFRTLGPAEGVRENSARAITSDGHGQIWSLLGTDIFEWNEKAGQFRPLPNPDHMRYKPLDWDGTGFWGTEAQNLVCLSYGKWSKHVVPSSIPLRSVDKVAVGADGAVWLQLPQDHFARFFDQAWTVHSKPFLTAFQNPERRSWQASIDAHLDRTLHLPVVGAQDPIRYNTIVEDGEHNVWVGSEGKGIFRIQRETIHVYSVAQGLAGAGVYPVLRDLHGDIWVGTWPAGLTQFHHGEVSKTYRPKDGLPGLVTALADDGDGGLWIGTHGGLAFLSQGHIRAQRDLPSDFSVIQAILALADETLFLGTPDGLYKFAIVKNSEGVRLQPQGKLMEGDVRVLVKCRHGDLWVGGYSGLTRIHAGILTHWSEHEGLPSATVRSVYEDADGVLWVGTYDGGLGRYADNRWTRFTKDDGLFDNGAFQILEDAHANLWMSSNRGIYRVDKNRLNDIANGKAKKMILAPSYGRSDGLLNAECNGGLWPAGAQDDEGNLWFPTEEGVAVVDTNLINRNTTPPKVVIESVLLDHVQANANSPITIRPGQGGLEIQYAALSFSKPEQVVFRYMMDGLDSTWEEVGSRRTAYFSHMPSGSYTFRVMAANSDGVWSAPQESIPIKVLPPFYLTGWFIALMCGLLLLMTYVLWILRVAEFKRRANVQQAFAQELIASQENERRRISAELHDSLGQRLIVIKNLAYFLRRPKAAGLGGDEQQQTLDEMSSEVSQAIEETRTISYNLRPFQLDRLGLSKAIEALVRSIGAASEIRFQTSIENVDESFPEAQRINVYRIIQEATNNILKHSGATEAEIRIQKTSQGVTLMISDNGKGFTQDTKSVSTGKSGFGLIGIRERTLLMGGTVKIQSNPDSGAVLRFEFPLYEHRS